MEDKKEFTLIVCGHGRCGTSLVMQMLNEGGFATTGEHPAFEVMEYQEGDANLPLNKAVKIIDPHRIKIKKGNYKWIWINRDHKQQAKSMVKFLAGFAGLNLPNSAWKDIASSYRQDTKDCVKKIKILGGKALILNFEDILKFPIENAKCIQELIGNLDAEKAASVVKQRTSKNYNGFLEAELTKQE